MDNKNKWKPTRDKYLLKYKDRKMALSKIHYLMNRDRYIAKDAKRRAQQLNATPKWLTKEHLQEIEMFYTVAAWLNNWKMTKFHVDHIVPLQGKEVSGLHVPWNLQILTAEENIKKGNRYE